MPKSTKPSGIGHIRGRARVTMHDIARVAGCSQPTVSFVLNGNTGVKISKLGQGLPVGGEIESLDDGTLFSAFKNRTDI